MMEIWQNLVKNEKIGKIITDHDFPPPIHVGGKYQTETHMDKNIGPKAPFIVFLHQVRKNVILGFLSLMKFAEFKLTQKNNTVKFLKLLDHSDVTYLSWPLFFYSIKIVIVTGKRCKRQHLKCIVTN